MVNLEPYGESKLVKHSIQTRQALSSKILKPYGEFSSTDIESKPLIINVAHQDNVSFHVNPRGTSKLQKV